LRRYAYNIFTLVSRDTEIFADEFKFLDLDFITQLSDTKKG